MLDQATSQLAPGENRRRRVAGLVATPAEPIPEDMQTALNERQALIEARARQLVREAQDAEAAWIARLGKPPTVSRARARWQTEATTIALHRHRYEIGGPSPLGDVKDVRAPEQATELRAAQAALTRLRRLTKPPDTSRRRGIDEVRRL